MEEIVNRVASSALEVFDLEDYFQEGPRMQIDLAIWLEDGCILKEKPFRDQLRTHNWEQYQDAFVSIVCATEAILPAWAFTLVASHILPYAKKTIAGSAATLEIVLYDNILSKLDYEAYRNKSVIIKGCSKKPVPEEAYILALTYLQPVAKSIMYGEACSAVPIFKKR
jgi:hypothetical protein